MNRSRGIRQQRRSAPTRARRPAELGVPGHRRGRSVRLRLAGLALAFTLLPTLLVAQSPSQDPEALETRSESWKCRNDLEVQCGSGGCETEAGDGFTPMSVSAGASGELSVCAYSGCWEGAAEVVRSERFLVLIGHHLAFSTSPEASSEDIVIAIDRKDTIATLKVGEFAHPLLCESLGHTEEPRFETSGT